MGVDQISEELSLTVQGITESGERIVKFEYEGIFEEILEKLGTMPLPPYIKTKLKDKSRYQTVYAKYDGSAAAPTAGLPLTFTSISPAGIREMTSSMMSMDCSTSRQRT